MTEPFTGRLELIQGLAFRASSGTGHTIALDTNPEYGGTDTGMRPLELLLLGLGGCTGMDVIGILRKQRQMVTGYEVRLHGERAGDHPKVFTRITVEHVVRGQNLDPQAVRRAVELSATRYCAAGAMLRQAAPIEERYRVIDEASGTEVTGAVEAGRVPVAV